MVGFFNILFIFGGWGVGDELFSVLKNSWVFKQYIGRKDLEKILYLVHFKNHLRSYFKSYELFIVQKAFLFMWQRENVNIQNAKKVLWFRSKMHVVSTKSILMNWFEIVYILQKGSKSIVGSYFSDAIFLE